MSLARLVFFSLSSILYPCVSHDIPECNPLVRKLLYEAADKIKEHNLLREQQGIYTLIEDTVYTWIVLWAEIKTNDYGVKYVSLPPLFKMVRKLVDTDNTIPQTYSLKRAAKIIADCMFLEGVEIKEQSLIPRPTSRGVIGFHEEPFVIPRMDRDEALYQA